MNAPATVVKIRTSEQAIAAAMRSRTNSVGYCQQWTHDQYNAPSAGDVDHDGDADAVDGWLSEPVKYRHPGDRNPPAGMPVAFSGGSHSNGHRCISRGRNGQLRSTDAPRAGFVGNVSIEWIEEHWGLEYLGWSETISGILIPKTGRAKKWADTHKHAA